MSTSFNDTMGMMQAHEFDLMSHSSHRRCGPGHNRSIFLEPVKEEFLCRKCTNVARFCVRSGCGHTFCHCCLLSMKDRANKSGKRAVCPVDRRLLEVEKCRFVPEAEGDIQGLRVRCANHETGCKDTFPLANMEFHVNSECKYRRVKCEVCETFVMASSLDDHLKDMDVIRAHVRMLGEANAKLRSEMDAVTEDVTNAREEHSVASTKLNELRQVLEEVRGHQSARLDVIEEYLRHKAGQDLFPSTTILSPEQQEALQEVHATNCGWALLYKASLSGLKPEVFHSLVDGHRNTMVVFQSGGGDVFGAFASQSWENELPASSDEPQWKIDDRAYIFSICEGDDDQVEVTLEHEDDDNPLAVCCHGLLGPTWGDGEQIFMGGRFGTSEYSVTADGTIVYSTPGPMSDDQIQELEVYVQIE